MKLTQEYERVITHINDVSSNEKEKKSIFGAIRGDLILTNKRLVFIKTGWGIHIKSYEDVTEIEKSLQTKKENFDIPLTSVMEAESDSHMMSTYLTVRYQAPSGPKVRNFFVPATYYFEADKWVKMISQEANKVRYSLASSEREEPVEYGDRSLIILDQTHTGYVGEIVNKVFLETLESMRDHLNLEDPLILKGKPKDELLMKNRELLPRTILLVFLGIKSNKFSQSELEIIESYVREGGRLLITPDPPFDPPNLVTERFGLRFRRDTIEDRLHHEGKHKDHIIVTDLKDHPINEGVKSICFGDYGCYQLGVAGREATVLAFSSEDSDPPNTPVAALIPYGSGQVVAIGQAHLFERKYLDMGQFNNAKWLKNIINFLSSTESLKEPDRQFESGKLMEPEQKYCTNCGAKLDPDGIYCGHCGFMHAQSTIPQPNNMGEKVIQE
jgi:hypothetical protein